jgi:hypothetical protein
MVDKKVLRRILGPKKEEVTRIGRKSRSIYIILFSRSITYCQIKENGAVWACGTYGREGKCIHNFDTVTFSKVYMDSRMEVLPRQFVCETAEIPWPGDRLL